MVIRSDGAWSAGPPMWHGWTEGPYKGRIEWWADYRYKDNILRSGKWRLQYYQTPDQDPQQYDPPVADGKSKYGVLQNDAKYVPNRSMPMTGPTKPMPLAEWQDIIYKGSWQYQEIAKKWKLSKEHPGLTYSPGASMTQQTARPSEQSKMIPRTSKFTIRSLFPGPRFHDSPLGENIHEKPIAMVRAAAIFAPVAAIMKTLHIDKCNEIRNWRLIGSNTWLMFRAPAILGGVWGYTLALSCRLRGVDDFWNGVYASAACTAAMRTTFGRTTPTFLPMLIVSTAYYMVRHNENGYYMSDSYRLGSMGPLVHWLHDVMPDEPAVGKPKQKLW